MPSYIAFNDGLSLCAVDAGHVVKKDEVLFDHLPTTDELAGAFPNHAAASTAANAPAQRAAALRAGLQVTSAATPALNGTYAVDDATRNKIAVIAAGKKLPGGGATFNYPDAGGTLHAFKQSDFANLATAVDAYAAALVQTEAALVGGHGAAWPPPAVTIP